MKKDKPSMLVNISKANISYNIKLRYRKTSPNAPYILYLDVIHNGKRQTKTLGISIVGDKINKIRDDNNIKKALQIRQKFQTQFDKSPDNFSFTKMDFTNFIDFFEEMTKRKSDKNYRLSFTKFTHFYTDSFLDIGKIDYGLCEDFKAYLISLDISNHTVKHYFTCFKGCLNDAVKRGLIDRNPAKGIAIRYEKKSIERLIDSELYKLWQSPCDYHDLKNAFLFSCYTGLRFSDIIDLRFDDINNNRIKVMQNKTLNEVEIPLHSVAQKILSIQRQKYSDDKIFCVPTGGKTSRRLQKWMEDSGIQKHITFHCARHTFGCLLVEKGVNLFVVKKLMGHRKIETTLQYVNKANVDAKAAIDRLPEI
jgi:integrase